MIRLYHGTRYENGLAIGLDTKMLSPYEQEMKKIIERSVTVSEARDWAERRIREMYAEHEREYRGRCISLTPDRELAKRYAQWYEEKGRLGGVVFEFEIEELPRDCLRGATIYVPDSFSLDSLSAIHFTPKAWEEENYNKLTDLFERYKVDYCLL